jgi:hypothetical protein
VSAAAGLRVSVTFWPECNPMPAHEI